MFGLGSMELLIIGFAVASIAGYAWSITASQEAGQRLNDHANATAPPPTETGNPYQPPIVADPDHVAKDRT